MANRGEIRGRQSSSDPRSLTRVRETRDPEHWRQYAESVGRGVPESLLSRPAQYHSRGVSGASTAAQSKPVKACVLDGGGAGSSPSPLAVTAPVGGRWSPSKPQPALSQPAARYSTVSAQTSPLLAHLLFWSRLRSKSLRVPVFPTQFCKLDALLARVGAGPVRCIIRDCLERHLSLGILAGNEDVRPGVTLGWPLGRRINDNFASQITI